MPSFEEQLAVAHENMVRKEQAQASDLAAQALWDAKYPKVKLEVPQPPPGAMLYKDPDGRIFIDAPRQEPKRHDHYWYEFCSLNEVHGDRCSVCGLFRPESARPEGWEPRG